MQDQYVGDFGDFVKYALLRALSKGRRLGVAWYLYPHEEGTAGNKVQYLDEPCIWRPLDPDLFDGMQDIIGHWRDDTGQRAVSEVANRDLLRHTIFADELLCFHPRSDDQPRRAEWRHNWFDRVIERVKGCDVVFADPDNGLCDNGKFHYDGRNGDWKKIPLCEALDLSSKRCAVIYHHNSRREGGHREEIAYWMGRIPGCTHAFYCRRYSPRTFFIINPDSEIVDRLVGFAECWQPHCELIVQEG